MPVELTRRNFRQYDRDSGEAGLLAPMPLFGSTTLTLTASRAHISRFVPSRNMTITLIGFVVTTAASLDDACDVGIYDASLNRLVSSGATVGKLNTTGVKTVAVTATTLLPGAVYYAGFSVGTIGGTAAALATSNNAITSGAQQIFGASAPQVLSGIQATAHPLPATLTNPPTALAQGVLLAVRES